jgi:hypothetical protein
VKTCRPFARSRRVLLSVDRYHSAGVFPHSVVSQTCGLTCGLREIGGVKIVPPGNPDQREERIPASISQRRSHPVWGRGLADGAYGPVRGNLFP